jgi:hypothetical protein
MSDDQKLNMKIQKLANDWKIVLNENGWEEKLQKEYKSMKYTYIFSAAVTIILGVIASAITLVALFAERSTIMGIEMNQQTFTTALIATLSLSISMNAAGLKTRFEKIKTFLFLKDMHQ